MFQALILNQEDKRTLASIEQIDEAQLPEGDVLIAVDYSSLNYKDGLAITGKGKIIRQFPMVPGIDLAGKVISSQDARYQAGDDVVLTGWGVGENHWGGMAQKARLKGDWLVPLPQGFDGKQAMMIGTAGFTAMLCVQALLDAGIQPQDGEIVVTGASGGVGFCRSDSAGHTGLSSGRGDRSRGTKRSAVRKTGREPHHRPQRV